MSRAPRRRASEPQRNQLDLFGGPDRGVPAAPVTTSTAESLDHPHPPTFADSPETPGIDQPAGPYPAMPSAEGAVGHRDDAGAQAETRTPAMVELGENGSACLENVCPGTELPSQGTRAPIGEADELPEDDSACLLSATPSPTGGPEALPYPPNPAEPVAAPPVAPENSQTMDPFPTSPPAGDDVQHHGDAGGRGTTPVAEVTAGR